MSTCSICPRECTKLHFIYPCTGSGMCSGCYSHFNPFQFTESLVVRNEILEHHGKKDEILERLSKIKVNRMIFETWWECKECNSEHTFTLESALQKDLQVLDELNETLGICQNSIVKISYQTQSTVKAPVKVPVKAPVKVPVKATC